MNPREAHLSDRAFITPVSVDVGERHAGLNENTTRREKPRSGGTFLGFSGFDDKRSAVCSRAYRRGDPFGGYRDPARETQMHFPTSTEIEPATHYSVPPVPIEGNKEGNRKIARLRSGNTACSRRSPRSVGRDTRTRAKPLYYTSLLWERGEQGEQRGVSPPPSVENPVPLKLGADGNGGNRPLPAFGGDGQ